VINVRPGRRLAWGLTAASVARHSAGGQGSIHSRTLAMVLMASVSSPNCRWLAQPG